MRYNVISKLYITQAWPQRGTWSEIIIYIKAWLKYLGNNSIYPWTIWAYTLCTIQWLLWKEAVIA